MGQADRSKPDRLETIACDYCNCDRATLLFEKNVTIEESALPIVRCRQCSLCYLARRLPSESLRALYDEDYFNSDDSGQKGYDHYDADREDILKTFRRRLRRIEKLRNFERGRVLDVGCATGFFLEAAVERGWSAKGIEISQYAADVAKSRGIDVRVGEFLPEASGEPPESFEAITMWDYIEHVREPGAEIRRAAELLAPNGVFALATPNIASIPARLFRSKWMGIKPKEHLYYFDTKSLTRYLRDAGLDPVAIEHTGKYVSLDFFAQRVGFYSRILEKTLRAPLRLTGLGSRSVYINPFDIILVMATKKS